MLAFQDVLDHMLAFSGDDVTAPASLRQRRAIVAAYQAMPSRHPWAYLYGVARIVTSAVYGDGTIAYTHTGGAVERQLTLTGGVWPSWAAYGYVAVNDTPYTVAVRVSNTVVQLAADENPGADVAAGTEYSLRRDSYPLPATFVSVDEIVVNGIGSVLEFVPPRDWSSQRRMSVGPGTPRGFSLVGDPNLIGKMRLVLTPPPDSAYQLDMLFRRTPRPIFYDNHSVGTVTTSGTTVTGVATAFSSRMVGSLMRFGQDNQTTPSGEGSLSPYAYERSITGFTSSTALTIDSALPADVTDPVAFTITDPIDIDVVGMTEYFLRECEKQYRVLARSSIKGLNEDGDYQRALTVALENDAKSTGRQAAMRRQTKRSGFNHYPMNFFG